MRPIATLFVVCCSWSAAGCASGLQSAALLTTAAHAGAPSAASKFASVVENYSTDTPESTGFRQQNAPRPESDPLPLPPLPEAIDNLAGEAPSGVFPQDGPSEPSPLDAHQAASYAMDPAPIAPGPEAIAVPQAEDDSDQFGETDPVIEAGHTDADEGSPLAQADAFDQPIVAEEVEFEADTAAEVDPPPAPEVTDEGAFIEPWPELVAAANNGEVIVTPEAQRPAPFKPSDEDIKADRVGRHVAEVPIDIRPTEGLMPQDLAAAEFPQQAREDARRRRDVEPVVCAYTPWTICYRPLYFEEVKLERFGIKTRFIQPAVSGVHFFSNVALLPYKMRLRPPRSCECGNGASRIGDCLPPGYGDCYWRWDAALVEAAAVTGFVFILP